MPTRSRRSRMSETERTQSGLRAGRPSQVSDGILRVTDVAAVLLHQRRRAPPRSGPGSTRIEAQIEMVLFYRPAAEPISPIHHGEEREPGVPHHGDPVRTQAAYSGHRRLQPSGADRLVPSG